MKLVDSNSDLWDGSIDIPFDVFEDGNPVPANTGVWTGTFFFGLETTGNELGFASIGIGNATQGAIPATNESWVEFGVAPKIDESGVVKRHFYALSSVLTIPVHTPVFSRMATPSPPTRGYGPERSFLVLRFHLLFHTMVNMI